MAVSFASAPYRTLSSLFSKASTLELGSKNGQFWKKSQKMEKTAKNGKILRKWNCQTGGTKTKDIERVLRVFFFKNKVYVASELLS